MQKVHFQRIVVIPHGLGHSNNRRHCDCFPYDRDGLHCIVEVSSSGPVVFEQTTEAPVRSQVVLDQPVACTLFIFSSIIVFLRE